MSLLKGYDEWKTREPDFYGVEKDLFWQLYGYGPRCSTKLNLGEFETQQEAEEAGEAWLNRQQSSGVPDDYFYEVLERDRNEDCTCWRGRVDKWCVVHGKDPDDARDQMRDR